MRKRVVLFLSLMALFIILVMLNFTTPMEVGPFGVLVFFTMIYVLFFGILALIGTVFCKIFNRKKELGNRGYAYVVVVSFGPVLFLLMRSFGMEMMYSGVLSVIFVGLSCFLVKKSFKKA